jgi:homoserine acetyltransferase
MTATLEMTVTVDSSVDWDQWTRDRITAAYAISGAARSGDWETALRTLRAESLDRNIVASAYTNELHDRRGVGWRAMAKVLGISRSTIEGRYARQRVPVRH